MYSFAVRPTGDKFNTMGLDCGALGDPTIQPHQIKKLKKRFFWSLLYPQKQASFVRQDTPGPLPNTFKPKQKIRALVGLAPTPAPPRWGGSQKSGWGYPLIDKNW